MIITQVDNYTPTRVIFGAGRLDELATVKLPGKKALVCITEDGLMEKLGILQRVLELLDKNGVEHIVFNKIAPNPTKQSVMLAAATAKAEGCDFFLGLGGGSSIDTAKAAAIMAENEGDLWEYAYTGSGGRKSIEKAAPVVAISTTSGTGTETDPYCVVTNEETNEKLDFAVDAIFSRLSIIDPELMLTLPRSLTIFQGFDALFHLAECYITNDGVNHLVDLYAEDGLRQVAKWLPVVVQDGKNIEARTSMAYAADILAGYTQSLISTTSHHILGQCLGGLYPKLPHGASLILVAEEYYKAVCGFFPELFDRLGGFLGEEPIAGKPGEAFVVGLCKLLDATGARHMPMSEYGITKDRFEDIARITVDVVGIDCDRYTLTKADIVAILKRSYR